MQSFTFVGEESARFTRFAMACIAVNIKPVVLVTGREPLTSRPIELRGRLEGAVLDRYVRYFILHELQSGVAYWVAGSNATLSVAAKAVSFELSDDDVAKLKEHGATASLPVPRLKRARDEIDPLLWAIETSIEDRSDSGLRMLLESLANSDDRVVLEAALTLRAYSSFVVDSPRRQRATEREILLRLPQIKNIEARIALVEDLGYFGSEESVPTLASLLSTPEEDDHVHWAAAIALGRLPGVNPRRDLSAGLSRGEWAQVATLLSMSRHATDENRAELEPIFREYLGAAKQPRMIRYACLGLSRFEKHEVATSQALTAILGDDELPVGVRGYAALAFASALGNVASEVRKQVQQVMERFAKYGQSNITEPEAIWGLEFLGELASLLELNEVSSALNGVLADNFDDWRRAYYTSMKYYEQGESCARRGLGNETINAYDRALNALRSVQKDLPPEATATIQFRRDLVEARQRLQSLLGSWLDAVGGSELKQLSEAVPAIRAIYLRYAPQGGRSRDRQRQLVDREIAYIRNTADLVSAVRMLIDFDATIKGRAFREDEASLILQELHATIDEVKRLTDRFEGAFASSLREVVDGVLLDLQSLVGAFTSEQQVSLPDKLRLARSAMTRVRSAFWKASWPMPARAYPLYGLGRASITIRREGITGAGTEQNPFIFPKNTEPVLLITVQIAEMASGANTTLYLDYSLGEHRGRRNIPIVEDQHTFSVHLARRLPPYALVRCDLVLMFAARDCTQEADSKVIYLRGDAPR